MHKKSNSSGISHHLLLPILAVLLVAGIGGYVMQRGSSAASKSCVQQTFKSGSNGTCVKYIQTLANFKYSAKMPKHAKIAVDGKFGAKTESGIKAFQKFFKIKANGVVGQKTWANLCSTQMGYTDANGKNHAAFPTGFPKKEAKAAGCKY